MIKTLDLHRIWEIMNILSSKAELLAENGIYVHFLGWKSSYYSSSYEDFLDCYSFKINDNSITIYNDDGVPYEDYTNDDFSYLPIVLLSMSDEEIEAWAEYEKDQQLEKQRQAKIAEKAEIGERIRMLQKQLNQIK